MMVERFAVHGSDQAKVIGSAANVGKQLGKFHTAFALRRKLKRAAQHAGSRLDERQLQILGH